MNGERSASSKVFELTRVCVQSGFLPQSPTMQPSAGTTPILLGHVGRTIGKLLVALVSFFLRFSFLSEDSVPWPRPRFASKSVDDETCNEH